MIDEYYDDYDDDYYDDYDDDGEYYAPPPPKPKVTPKGSGLKPFYCLVRLNFRV